MEYFTNLFLTILLTGQTLFVTCQSEVPCAPIRTRSCPGVEPKASLVGVYVQDCFEEPCIFRKAQNVTMEMDIDFKGDVQNLEAKLYASIGSIEVGWDGLNPNACEDILSVKDCPFQDGDYVTYGVNLYIGSAYPTVPSADVKFVVLDEKKEIQVCWIIKASVLPS